MAKIIYIDTETTGLYPNVHGLIQLAGMIEIDGAEVENFDLRIKPFPEDKISEKALEVNNMTMDEINGFPEPKDQYNRFTSMLGKYVDKYDRNDKFYFIGYNARFDMDFLRAFFGKCGDKYFGSWFFFPPIDVMNLVAVDMMNKDKRLVNYKLETAINHYGISIDGIDLHDAINDIRITKELYGVLRNG